MRKSADKILYVDPMLCTDSRNANHVFAIKSKEHVAGRLLWRQIDFMQLIFEHPVPCQRIGWVRSSGVRRTSLRLEQVLLRVRDDALRKEAKRYGSIGWKVRVLKQPVPDQEPLQISWSALSLRAGSATYGFDSSHAYPARTALI